jgi:hypothetical protein
MSVSLARAIDAPSETQLPRKAFAHQAKKTVPALVPNFERISQPQHDSQGRNLVALILLVQL